MFWLIGWFRGLIGWRGGCFALFLFAGRQVWQKSALSLEEQCWGAGPREGLVPFISLIGGSRENEGLTGEKNPTHLSESLALSKVTAL